MPNVISLTCPSCGGKLQITNDIERFSCGYCGNEQIVQRSGGVITLAPVVEGLKEVKKGVDKTASELAIVRLKEEINNLSQQRINASRGTNSCIIVFIVVFIGVSILSPLCLIYYGLEKSIFLFIGLVLVIIISIIIFKDVQRAARRATESIDKVIAEKEQELEKHQAIVAGK